jgi:uncharacterized protein (DUF2141 family)
MILRQTRPGSHVTSRKAFKFAVLLIVMNKASQFFIPGIFLFLLVLLFWGPGCGQPIPPTGGPRDSLPPALASAEPADSALNFRGNRITLEFNEYITLDNPFEKLVFTPLPAKMPVAEGKLKTVTIKLKDSLEPNTTYSIDFGDAIRDINEGNILRHFRYTFSTGAFIDSGTLAGRVFIAETGQPDSTLIVLLHRNLEDSAVETERPRYYSKIDRDGNFQFRYLSAGTYNVYALKDADGGKKFDQKSELFAFLDQPVNITDGKPVILYAFAETPDEPIRAPGGPQRTTATPRNKDDKRLRFSTNLEIGKLDILGDLILTFENKLSSFDTALFRFTDENFNSLPAWSLIPDSTRTKLILKHTWSEGKKYNIILEKDFAKDSAGNAIMRTDTLSVQAKTSADYGSLRIRISNLDTAQHPVLLIYRESRVELVQPLKTSAYQYKLFRPGEYDIRILYDRNGNGTWDTGNFHKKLQPEIVIARKQKLTIRANWDNELEINIQQLDTP